jgi:RNA polymerase sigma-70 factor (ECF subfamily)
LESVWEQEWQRNLLELALERLKSDVNPKQYQIFHGYVIAGQPVRDVAQKAGVSQPQVYWVKHQFSRLLQAKIKILEQTLY